MVTQTADSPQIILYRYPRRKPCPICNTTCERADGSGGIGVTCTNPGCGWKIVAPSGYRFPSEWRMTPCPEGHKGAWVGKKVGPVTYWLCALVTVSTGKVSRCSLADREGPLQGFLDPDKDCAAPYETRESVIKALYECGPEGGQIPDMLDDTPALTIGRITGSLDKLRRYRFPFVQRSSEREPRPKAGSAYRYFLTWRGLAYAYLRWPELRNNGDFWKDENNK